MFFIVEFNKLKNFFKKCFYGIIIGASMMIPGFSGGTAAIILGVFYDIMNSLSSMFKNVKQSIKELLPFVLGGCLGIFLICYPLSFVLTKYQIYFNFFIIGVVLGSVKYFLPKAEFRLKSFLWIALGAIPVVLQHFLKYNFIDLSGNYLFLIFIGMLSSIALILPGISLTNILISFGYYEKLIDSIINLDILFLSVFFISLIAGIFISVKIIIKIYSRHTETINLILLGMILGSLIELYIGMPNQNQILSCILFLIGGACVSFVLGRLEK